MQQTNNNAAKFAFFYMLSLVALVFMALSSGMIIFQIINKSIVDIISEYQGRFSPEALKFAISALIVSAPIFYITARQIYKNLFTGSLSKDSGIRKWLTYLILLATAVVMIGWLIATVNSFLDGDLTFKFVLKAITAIFIAAAVFTFYLYDIKREEIEGRKDSIVRVYFYGSLIIVIAVFVASLFFVESPTETRNRKLDNAILEDFNMIDGAIVTYYQENEEMPASLDILEEEFSYIGDDDVINPVTGEEFEYRILADRKYELCTIFMSDNKDREDDRFNFYKDRWPHESGYQCLSQKVHNIENVKERIPAELYRD